MEGLGVWSRSCEPRQNGLSIARILLGEFERSLTEINVEVDLAILDFHRGQYGHQLTTLMSSMAFADEPGLPPLKPESLSL
jgi:hypothetical protein